MCLSIPGRILEIRRDADPYPCAVVDCGGVRADACLALVPEAEVGDYVLLHSGFALETVEEAEALSMLAALRALGDAA